MRNQKGLYPRMCDVASLCCVQTRGLPCCESGVTRLNQWNYSGFSPTQGHAAFGSGYWAAHTNLTHTLCIGTHLSSFLTVLLSKISLDRLVHDFTSVTPENSIAGATVLEVQKK